MDELADTPNCPQCLVRMEAVEKHGAYFWKCAECGLVRL